MPENENLYVKMTLHQLADNPRFKGREDLPDLSESLDHLLSQHQDNQIFQKVIESISSLTKDLNWKDTPGILCTTVFILNLNVSYE